MFDFIVDLVIDFFMELFSTFIFGLKVLLILSCFLFSFSISLITYFKCYAEVFGMLPDNYEYQVFMILAPVFCFAFFVFMISLFLHAIFTTMKVWL